MLKNALGIYMEGGEREREGRERERGGRGRERER